VFYQISTGTCSIPQVTVPDIEKLHPDSIPHMPGLTFVKGETALDQCDNSIPAGNIISQNPAKGAMVDEGTVVQYQVSTGICVDPTFIVPIIVRLLPSELLAVALSFQHDSNSDNCSDDIEMGRIISQNPQEGVVADKNSIVIYGLSTGPCDPGIDKVRVPDLIGDDPSQISFDKLNFIEGSDDGNNCSDEHEQGRIISLNPSVGSELVEGSNVIYQVSTGPCILIVPSIEGLRADAADTAIRNAGFDPVNRGDKCDNEHDQGLVAEQTLPAGIGIDPDDNTEVGYYISSGPCPISVPSVDGSLEADAITAITDAGLNPVNEGPGCSSDQYTEGNVFDQDPSAGAPANAGDDVHYMVSNGPCHVTVPDVDNLTIQEAQDAITDARLKPVSRGSDCKTGYPEGNVFEQDPVAGTTVVVDSDVSYRVSIGDCVTMVLVPAIDGLSETIAKADIETAGLLAASTTDCSNVHEYGVVFNQSPTAGTEVSSGAIVNYIVSTGGCR